MKTGKNNESIDIEYYFDIDGSYKARKVDTGEKKKATIKSDEKVSDVAKRLQYYMKKNNKSQSDIHRACQPFCQMYDVRIGSNDISNYFNGKTRPSQNRLTILSKALKVSEVWLLGYDVPQKFFDDSIIENKKKSKSNKAVETEIEYDFKMIVNDDSLFNDRIFKNDVVYFKKQKLIDNGDLIAAMFDGKQVIKRVYFYYKDKNTLILKTSNPYEDIICDINDPKISILGKAVAFISKHVNY